MKESIILFGTGNYAKKVRSTLEQNYEIMFVADNDQSKWGRLFEDKYLICSPETISDYEEAKVCIAIDNKSVVDCIIRQLENVDNVQHVNEALLDAAIENNKLFHIEIDVENFVSELNKYSKNIFVFTAPAHSNLGDQAQSYCIERIIREKDSDSKIWFFDEEQIIRNYYELLYVIKQNIRENDIVYLHSGYRLTDLYMVSENIVEIMLDTFKERKILFLPQTINFQNTEMAENLSRKISSNITIMCRDRFSYKKSLELFPQAKSLLFPDVVTSLIGRREYCYDRSGILACLRAEDDGESAFHFEQINGILEKTADNNQINYTDTTICEDWHEIVKNKEKYIFEEIDKYAHFSLVITDRFHGTVFALAANTPVIVLPTKDHKVTSSLEWFSEAGINSLFYCDRIDRLGDIIQTALSKIEYKTNPDYLYNKYFSDLCLEDYLLGE